MLSFLSRTSHIQPMSPIGENRLRGPPPRGDRRPPRADVPVAWDDSNWAIAWKRITPLSM